MIDDTFCYAYTYPHLSYAIYTYTYIYISTVYHIFTVPPDRISIKDDTGVERSTVVGPYAEGDIITLSCEVFGGKYIHSTTLSIYIL